MSESIHRAHNVSNIMYHFVCPTKYRQVVIDNSVDEVIKETCRGIEVRYEIFLLYRMLPFPPTRTISTT